MPRIWSVHQCVLGAILLATQDSVLKWMTFAGILSLRDLYSLGVDFEYPVSVTGDSPHHRTSF